MKVVTIVEVATIILTAISLVKFSQYKKSGWVISMVLNGLWFYIGSVRDVPVILFATAIYLFFNIKGYIAWNKKEGSLRI